MLSCETCEIYKNIYFQEHLWTTASTGHYRKNYSSTSFTKLGLDNYHYNLSGLKISFALLCSCSFCWLSFSELIDYQLETFFPKIAHTWILKQFTFTLKWFQFSTFYNINRALDPNIPGSGHATIIWINQNKFYVVLKSCCLVLYSCLPVLYSCCLVL